MLQKMGEHIHGWIAATFVVIISVVFALFGVSSYFSAGDPSAVTVAKVNGEKLSRQMLSNDLMQVVRSHPSLAAAGSQERLALKKQLADQWIDQQAMLTTLYDAGMIISPDVIRNLILSTFQVNGSFSPELLNQYMTNQGFANEEQLYDVLSKKIAVSTFNQAIGSALFTMPNSLSRYFLLLTQQRTFRYGLVQSSDFQNKIDISQSALQAYYKTHLSQYLAPETVSVDYVELSPANLESTIQLDLAQLQDYYQSHSQEFTKQASWSFVTFSVSDLRSHYLKADDATIQKMFTDQVNALKAAKNIPEFLKNHAPVTQTADTLNPAVITILKGLKPGQVSAIQKDDTLKGDLVYYIVSQRPSSVQSFDQVKDKIAELLKNQQVNDLLSAKSDQMTNLAYSNPESLDQIAKTLNLPIQTTMPFTRDGLKTSPASSSKFVATAFGDTVLTQGINSDPVTLADGSIVIMHLHKYTAAYTQSFATVESLVRKAYVQQQAVQLAQQQAHTLSDQLNQNKNVTLTWKNIDMAKVGDTAAPASIIQAVFDEPFAVGDKPVVLVVPMDDHQVAVVQLQALHVLPLSAITPSQSQKIQKQLITMQQQAVSKMVTNSILKNSKITVYKDRIV